MPTRKRIFRIPIDLESVGVIVALAVIAGLGVIWGWWLVQTCEIVMQSVAAE